MILRLIRGKNSPWMRVGGCGGGLRRCGCVWLFDYFVCLFVCVYIFFIHLFIVNNFCFAFFFIRLHFFLHVCPFLYSSLCILIFRRSSFERSAQRRFTPWNLSSWRWCVVMSASTTCLLRRGSTSRMFSRVATIASSSGMAPSMPKNRASSSTPAGVERGRWGVSHLNLTWPDNTSGWAAGPWPPVASRPLHFIDNIIKYSSLIHLLGYYGLEV